MRARTTSAPTRTSLPASSLIRAHFRPYDLIVRFGGDEFAGGKVNVASITTNDEQRDAHLRSPDFFDAENYPEITFESTRIEAIDMEPSQVFGTLTMHGVAREVKLEVLISGTDEDPWGNTASAWKRSASSSARTSI